jgi:hypothetical protein
VSKYRGKQSGTFVGYDDFVPDALQEVSSVLDAQVIKWDFASRALVKTVFQGHSMHRLVPRPWWSILRSRDNRYDALHVPRVIHLSVFLHQVTPFACAVSTVPAESVRPLLLKLRNVAAARPDTKCRCPKERRRAAQWQRVRNCHPTRHDLAHFYLVAATASRGVPAAALLLQVTFYSFVLVFITICRHR